MSLSSLKYLTLVQLKDIAKNKGIHFPANIRKSDLLAILEENLPNDYDVLQHFSNSYENKSKYDYDDSKDFESALFDVTNDESMQIKNSNTQVVNKTVNPSSPSVSNYVPRFGPRPKNNIQGSVQNNPESKSESNVLIDKSGLKFKQGYSIYNNNNRNSKKFSTIQPTGILEKDLIGTIDSSTLIEKEDTFKVSGFIDIINNSYGFIRKNPLIRSDNDVFVSNGIIDKYGLNSGDYIDGIATNNNGQKSSILLYVNNVHKEEIVYSDFNNAEPIYPSKKILNDNCDEYSIFTRMVDIVSPLSYGQRVLLVSEHGSGTTSLLIDLAKNIEINSKNHEVIFVSINSPSDEQNNIKNSIKGKFFGSTFEKGADEQIKVLEYSIEYSKQRANLGKNVIIIIDNLSQIINQYQVLDSAFSKISNVSYAQQALLNTKKVFSIAKNTKDSGTITLISAMYSDLSNRMDSVILGEFINNSSTVIYLDKELSDIYMFPAVDYKNTFSKQINLVTKNDEYDLLVKINRIFRSIPNKEAHKQFIDLIQKTNSNKELRKKLPEWFDIWEKISNI